MIIYLSCHYHFFNPKRRPHTTLHLLPSLSLPFSQHRHTSPKHRHTNNKHTQAKVLLASCHCFWTGFPSTVQFTDTCFPSPLPSPTPSLLPPPPFSPHRLSSLPSQNLPLPSSLPSLLSLPPTPPTNPPPPPLLPLLSLHPTLGFNRVFLLNVAGLRLATFN